MLKVVLFHAWMCLLMIQCRASSCDNKIFPKDFLFGVSTSAYQIEGAWKADGKSESIWDTLTHNKPYLIKDHSNGDVADNSYYLYKKDVELLKELGVNFYRFSISWSRILPTGFPNKVNKKGIEHYNKLINQLLDNGIMPVITLYHSDLPQRLQDLGGWANPFIIDWFGDYARVCFIHFGDRVKHWVTINEPHEICLYGYGNKLAAPAIDNPGIADYLCVKNIMFAHARAYYIYDEEFRQKQGGCIGIVIACNWAEPKSFSRQDVEAANDLFEFEIGLYANPILSEYGDYPEIVKKRVAINSKLQGFPRSRLPPLTKDDIEYLKGTADFFGLNHYTSQYVTRNESIECYYPSPSFKDDCGVLTSQPESWKINKISLTLSAPWGFYKILKKVSKMYNYPQIIIFENGYANTDGNCLNDTDRVTYLRSYMCAMLDAKEDGCDIRGYSIWSILDSFEWNSGYTYKFGLYRVDYKSSDRTRTMRLSGRMYKEVIQSRRLAYAYLCTKD